MIHFKFSDQDKRYVFLKPDDDKDIKVLRSLQKEMNLIDPICFLPTYKGIPFTQDFLFEYNQQSGGKIFYCNKGLWQICYKYLKTNNVAFDGLEEKYFKHPIKHSYEEFVAIVESWDLKYTPRPYQYEAAYKILQWDFSLSQLATRAGKTLISYMIFRYAMEYMGVKKILMIVPSVDLVKQAYSDFEEYAEFFNTECVWSGGKLVESANLTVGTFQSLIKFLDKKSKKYNPDFYNDFDCVFVDEVHRATAKETKTIISQPFMQRLKIGFGMTGTLPKEKSIENYCLHSILGAKIQEISPKQLMDEGYISNIEIHQHRLNYTNVDDLYIRCAEYWLGEYITQKNEKGKNEKVKLQNPKFLIQYEKKTPYILQQIKIKFSDKKEDYIDALHKMITVSDGSNALVVERSMVHFCDERITYLCNNILPQCPNNTLILCHHVEYIKYLELILKERFPDRHIEVVMGAVSSKKRDKVKQTLKDYNDCILIASYSCMSTGITLSNLCYGVLFESFKSNTVNMQSLGRGLGLSDMKEKYIVHDIIDCFPTKKLYLQGVEKCKIYKREHYQYNIISKDIEYHNNFE